MWMNRARDSRARLKPLCPSLFSSGLFLFILFAPSVLILHHRSAIFSASPLSITTLPSTTTTSSSPLPLPWLCLLLIFVPLGTSL